MSITPAEQQAQAAQQASRKLLSVSSDGRNHAIICIADGLKAGWDHIQASNKADIQQAQASNAPQSLIQRLELSDKKFVSLIDGLTQVASLSDPLGVTTLHRDITKDGMTLDRITCPIGVLCIIYEARPEAGVQITSLALKSGNALLLKGGKEAKQSNRAIFDCMRKGIEIARQKYPELPLDAVQLVEDREGIAQLLKLDQYIDLVIPRGSNELVRHIKESTKIPVLGHADGICHIYVDQEVGDVEQAGKIICDSKTNYPAACNAVETILVHSAVAETVIPKFVEAMKPHGVKYYCDKKASAYIPQDLLLGVKDASGDEDQWRVEHLDLIVSVKIVGGVDDAMEHINRFGSHHTDAIISTNESTISKFQAGVDSSSVYANCSTRFADGFRYGFGAEVGISTSKIHSRGPVGVEGLVIYKYLMRGQGQCVGEMGKTRHYAF